MKQERWTFKVEIDCHQFYLIDGGIGPPVPETWTNEDVARRLKVDPHIVVICPERYGVVPIALERHDGEPMESLDGWDHVAECSLDLPTGQLLVDECLGSPVAHLSLLPGSWRVRVFYGGLSTITDDEFDGDDYYTVLLWPGPPCELIVLKQCPPP